MACVNETTAALRFFGDDLDPDAISALLGALPTWGRRKGESWVSGRGVQRTARSGQWQLEAARRQPGDLDSQIAELLSPLTTDLVVWKRLAARFSGDIYCGLFMGKSNEGLELRSETLVMIGSRGLLLGFDIYGALPEEDDAPKGETM